MANEKLEIEIVLDDGSIKKGFATIKREAKKTSEESTTEFKKFTDGVGKNIKSLAVKFAAAFGAREVAKSIADSVREFGNFEQALVSVQKTTDLSNREISLLGNDIQNLSDEIPIATNELLKLAQQAGQFGVKGRENLLIFTDTVAKLGAAVDGIDPNEAAEGLVRILNIAGESTKEIKTLASVVVNLGNNLAATEGDIISASLEISRATAGFAISTSEVATLGAAISALGVRAESGGTAIGKTFRAIDKAILENSANLTKFAEITGDTADDFKKNFGKNAAGTFNDFIGGLNKIQKSGGNVSARLVELGLNNERVLKTLLPLVKGYDQLTNAVSLTADELKNVNALESEALRAFSTFNSETVRLTSAFTRLKTEIGALVSKPLAVFLRLIKESTIATTQFFRSFRGDAVGELTRIDQEIASIQERIKNAKDLGGGGGFLGFRAGDVTNVAALNAQLEELQKQRLAVAGQATDILAAENLAAGNQAVVDGLTTQTMGWNTLGEAVGGFANLSFNSLSKIGENFNTFFTSTAEESKKLEKALNNVLAKGVSSSIQKMVGAIASGEDAFAALGSSLLNMIGDLAITIGQFTVAAGIAKLALFSDFTGAQTIAAGIGLIAIGSVLKAIGGTGFGGSVASSGGGGETSIADPTATSIEQPEPEERKTEVNVTLQGNLVDRQGAALAIAELLTDEGRNIGLQVS